MIPNAPSAAILRQERLYDQSDPLGPLQHKYGVAPTLLEPGTYSTDVLGIDFEFTLTDWWRLDDERPGSMNLVPPKAPVGGLLPAFLVQRPVGLAPIDGVASLTSSRDFNYPPSELGQWLDDVEQINVLDTGEFRAGNRDATWWDVELDPEAGRTIANCVPGVCIFAWWSGSSSRTVTRDLESLRYYLIEDPLGPIFVLLAAEPSDFKEWVIAAEQVLGAATFGPSAPSPIRDGVHTASELLLPPGVPARVSGIVSLSLTPTRWAAVFQRPGYVQFAPQSYANFEAMPALVIPDSTLDGESIGSTGQLLELIEASGATRLDDEVIAGQLVPSYQLVEGKPLIRRVALQDGHDPAFAEWPELDVARVWVLETPDGPMLLAAEAAAPHSLDSTVEETRKAATWIEFDD